MKNNFKKLLFFLGLVSPLVLVSPAFAAAPDGAGPWADTVQSSTQGLRKDGSAVPAPRSDPNSALGVAENDTVEPHFFSLGFGGKIAVGFDNGISSGSMIVEATNPGYPNETAKVEMSEDGTTWVLAGNITTDGTVAKPSGITCAKYVRITDTSDPANFSDATADGFDVDGVKSTGDPCTPPTPPCDTNCGGCVSNITQTNTTVIVNAVDSKANTGNNKIKNTAGAGDKTITTGDAKSKVAIANGGSSNTATTAGCCPPGDTTVTIKDNGANSKNTVKVVSAPKKTKKGS